MTHSLAETSEDHGPKPYMNPYLAGVGLGLSLLAALFVVGRGLGASGAFTRIDAAAIEMVAPEHAHSQSYWKRYAGQDKAPLDDFLVYEVLGLIVGAMVSAWSAGRLRGEVYRGPRVGLAGRHGYALAGGLIAGFGARLANGCTSGLALTGGATLTLSGWIFMMCFFAAGFAGAALVRRQWL